MELINLLGEIDQGIAETKNVTKLNKLEMDSVLVKKHIKKAKEYMLWAQNQL
jgi:hypothetical protein